MSSLLEQASLVITPNAYKEGKLYGLKGTDLNVVRATTATRVNAEGLIESVANNVPRLDYSNGSCPSILVEPQRTNLALRSEEFDNASWVKPSGTFVTPNVSIAPDGALTADMVFGTNFNISQNISVGIGTYTFSVYLKSEGANIGKSVGIRFQNTPFPQTNITTDGTWQRVSVIITTTTSVILSPRILIFGTTNPVSEILAWGAQLEIGANATSYIPTVASAVTRNADVISKTGISDLIGQTEGTVFVEGYLNNFSTSASRFFITLFNDSTLERISLTIASTNNINLFIFDGNASSLNSDTVSLGKVKIALTFEDFNFKLFVNGTFAGAITNRNVPDNMNKINLGCSSNGTLQIDDFINSAILWKTQLTDQECINLTTL